MTFSASLDFSSHSPEQIKQLRRAAVQFLYQFDRNAQAFFREESFVDFCQQNELNEKLVEPLRAFASLCIDEIAFFDSWIEKKSENWSVSRMARVDVSILRVCLCELRFRPKVKAAIVIADAAEIAKEFGSERSQSFVHGILDGVYKEFLTANS